MSNTSESRIHGSLPERIDGIEVAKLLKTLGETSFDCNHEDLFSHCFQAYMVLSEVYRSALPAVSQHQGGGEVK
jgi:hypothetical protein